MKWSFRDSEQKSWRIAVAGIDKHVGVTHFSIMLGNYFRYKRGRRVCIVDLSGEPSYMNLEELYFGHNLRTAGGYFYTIHKLDFLVGMEMSGDIGKVLQGDYDVIIFDCGIRQELLEHRFELCDRKYVLGCCSPWNQRQWDTYLTVGQYTGEERMGFGYRYGYSFGAEENAHVIAEKYKVRLAHIPFIENPFTIRQAQMQRLGEIIWEEKYW